MLDRYITFTVGQFDILRRDVVLKINERLSHSAFRLGYLPERAAWHFVPPVTGATANRFLVRAQQITGQESLFSVVVCGAPTLMAHQVDNRRPPARDRQEVTRDAAHRPRESFPIR